MKEFAKIFNSEKHGQILVTIDSDDNGYPAITVMFKVEDDITCSFVGLTFNNENEDKAWQEAEKRFSEFTLKAVELSVSMIIDQLNL